MATLETTRTRPVRGLVTAGLLAVLAAMAATTLVAVLLDAVGVDFEIPAGGERIPVAGFTTVTGVFSVVGVVLAVALLRWSAHPARRFLQTALVLTALSLVPPLTAGADRSTVAALVVLHLVAAAVMVPVLVRGLRAGPGTYR